jgi:CelD/BcsL family acetyltransferase involved in cellulose biosynthesis
MTGTQGSAAAGKNGNAKGSRLVAVPMRDYHSLTRIWAEWADLVRAAQLGSPFTHPAWSLTWAKHFVPEGDLEYVVIRESDHAGRLVGVAPFYRRRRSLASLKMTTIQPIGTGQGDSLTEVVHMLALPDRTRDVLTAVVQHLTSLPHSDWVQLSVGDGQGWPLPQWLDGEDDGLILHRKTRPCVVLDDIPKDPELVLSGLKRNLRESLRRARNRSAKLGDISFHCVSDPDEIAIAVRHLIWLHAQRAEMPSKVAHPNMFGGAIDEFLCDAAVQLAREGLAKVFLAQHSRVPVAAQLVLSDASTDYISASGLNPQFWDLNLNTMLIFKAVQSAAGDGRRSVNLSTGPNVAKMRWSSKVVTHNDFDIVPKARRSQLFHQFFTHAALAWDHHQERRRHRVLDSNGGKNRGEHPVAETLTS